MIRDSGILPVPGIRNCLRMSISCANVPFAQMYGAGYAQYGLNPNFWNCILALIYRKKGYHALVYLLAHQMEIVLRKKLIY